MTGRRLDDALAREFVLAGVVDGSEVALDRLGADFTSEELAAFLAELLIACAELRWPQGASLPDLAAYVRRSRRFTEEGPDVSPMFTEAVMRAAVGDVRFIGGLSGELLMEHLAVALRIIVPDLQTRETSAAEIARAAGQQRPKTPLTSDPS